MRISNKLAVTILTALIALSSCSYLDNVEPLDTFSEKEIFGNETNLESYVTQRYAETKHALNRVALRFICDESWNNFNQDNTNTIQKGGMNPDMNIATGTWYDYYLAIRSCNIFMANKPLIATLKIDATSTAHVNQMEGEILFLRAFFYADLISKYGGVPIITDVFELDTPKDKLLVPRNSYQECVTFVVDELDKAATLLPVSYADKWLGRATKGAALALKSRVLLYAASPLWNTTNDADLWTKAANAAADVINLNTDGTVNATSGTKVYSLDSDYKGLFANKQSQEIIFQKLFSTEFGTYFDWYNAPNGFHGWSETCVSEGLVDAYEMADGSMPDAATLYGTDVDHLKEYAAGTTPWDGREPRFYATIACDGQPFKDGTIEYYINAPTPPATTSTTGGKDSGKGGIEEWNVSKTGFFIRKFTRDNVVKSWNEKNCNSWIFSRLGEIYLNYAEALYNTGKETEAKVYLNKIRERARGGASVLPDVTESSDALMAKIQHERRIELAFEEHRFFDVRRWKIAKTTDNGSMRGVHVVKGLNGLKSYGLKVVEKELKFYDQNYLMPIPRAEIVRNNLMLQNPKY